MSLINQVAYEIALTQKELERLEERRKALKKKLRVLNKSFKEMNDSNSEPYLYCDNEEFNNE